ncbi:mitochondrial 2-oxoglutarate/malate carrier protein isoform X2 [Halyomorpha halys]|nr:mitochondrial 2-oxoglutarate/malate carrier protein-like isoform X2 [Halyomorpha halys]XP_014274591.1 mitochondrial 2-oxoglutarate/malate carrier protein-like isoform X2 [Halyomorpha halys]XP_014274593.1 mitochondrial 2-oxoglutarate/malate carrier protein-like isoform X2 [Halyomorpha halys]XP_014274594.1 mitochondrial 2-oxoglutarate/malate carrier protein-like isoform X2 [Halyomorpha halys]XP_014274595.1 mitochondrial 2-oxoglutarate/malate carrier protein-like isoform X2 [Halyomorpha halys]
MAKEKEKPKDIPGYMKFIIGGGAGMTGTLFVQPLDLVKNRMQLSGVGTAKKEYTSSFDAISKIFRTEGPLAFYNGLSAGLLRQATYSSTRLGVYTWLFSYMSSPDGTPPTFLKKTLMGCLAGLCGAFVGTPAEVALIRMTADGKLPPEERRNYANVFSALGRITREEGILTLWRGVMPTMGRAVVVNAVQLATYSQAKEMFMKTGYFNEGIFLHFCSSMLSGFFTTIASLPLDIAKTRIQNMKMHEGKPEYRGTFDVIYKLTKNEGIFALWKGFTPYFARIGPHTVLTFIFLEQYTNLYKKYFMKEN